ncbi:DUF1214 domain-containing protein [Thalassotalea psychrophila]|uniref:DUF1214 domain-containing protein n=1 Tax=Thalassotalea psychrophila TaxID=3065647 RepID=A0ABY9TY59_9GAMM|nr:DUF1214 domain-containing protein [Colwelliaceae bacterium SQ149]
MKAFTKTLLALATTALLSTTVMADTIDTSVGKLEFTHSFEAGYPTAATAEKLFKDMDRQRATQAYLWAIPYVSFLAFEEGMQAQGMTDGQLLYMPDRVARSGGLTANHTTPYAVTTVDLTDSPMVIEIPDGVRGAAHSMWQIGLGQLTEAGKYLLMPKGGTIPADFDMTDVTVMESDTNRALVIIRVMAPDMEEQKKTLASIKFYSVTDHLNPTMKPLVIPTENWEGHSPHGEDFFRLLAKGLNNGGEIHERDRLIVDGLRTFGIGRGLTYNPTKEQKAMLEDASIVGESMAKALDFAGTDRLELAHYSDGSQWEIATTSPSDQRFENSDALDGRAAWFYEAITADTAMHAMTTGWGQAYLSTYTDTDGDYLNGKNAYVLHLDTPPPVDTFWSISIYDVEQRCLILNGTDKVGIDGRMNLTYNDDGSVDMYFSPVKPDGVNAANWVKTMDDKAWFPYFRFYSPKQEVQDRTWLLPDIQKAK